MNRALVTQGNTRIGGSIEHDPDGVRILQIRNRNCGDRREVRTDWDSATPPTGVTLLDLNLN